MKKFWLFVASTLLLSTLAAAQGTGGKGRAYPDGHGGEVFFPMGDVSFADAVERFTMGDPAPHDEAADAGKVLGIPDHEKNDGVSYVTLGCGGELVLQFGDNALIDVAGPDLYVFEIGPDVEPTGLAVSNDGEEWIRVGRISGGKAEIDLAPYVDAGTDFRYVKLVDLKGACGSRKTPGADIDAVGAIGSASRISLDSAVLFDTANYQLKPVAFEEIDRVLAHVENRSETSVEVAGHTDAVGSAEENEKLSRKRARAVASYLVEKAGFNAERVSLHAYGESRAVASNDSEAGRARNRRVELTLQTPRSDTASKVPEIEILGVWDANNHGILEMRFVDGEFEGEYTSDGGRLLGEFTNETVFEGYWVENNSRKSCGSEKAGSDHWGPLRIEFASPDRDEFVAYWRYCGEEEDRGTWKTAERLL